jgi:excinuclease ABC subunit C
VFDKKKAWQKKTCFSYQIGLCPGSCAGVISKLEYKKQINRLVQFLEGDSEKLRLNLEKEMQGYSKDLKFEEAQKIKEMLFALDHIRDAHLIHRDRNENDMRIEAYDISHISGTNRVGAMTVVLNGLVAKHEYKKFKISTDKNDDLEGLRELLERRFKHLEWGIPDIVVLDGDERHMRVAEKIFQNTKIVAVTKDKKHKAKSIIGNSNINKEEIENYKKEIILANSEVHRFALNYHRNLRSSGLNKSLKVK